MEHKQILGTYTILEPLGSGSGGTVFKAYHNRLEQMVVLKRLNNPKNSSLDRRKEVDILKNLKHSYLPQVLDFIETEDEVYTVMSFIEGKSFLQLLKEGPRFSRQELLKWGMQICSALNYLHTQKIPIIHGDIKPANIMLSPEGDICLIDFNISFYLDENTVLGYTDGYTSPEQYLAVTSRRRKGSSRYVINEKSDIYSVGATLYHLAMGRKRPGYQQDMDFGELAQLLGEPFANVIEKATHVEPEQRYESALKMFQALKAIPKRDKRYRQLVRRQQIYTGLLCAFLIGFLCLGAYGFTSIRGEKYNDYNEIVGEQIACIDNREFRKAEGLFKDAKEKIPSELEAYYQNAYSLYLQGQYMSCSDFIDKQIIENKKVRENRERMVDVYALKGLSSMELGDTEEAVKDYEAAIGLGAFDNQYYRDYAVALARNGQEKKAKEILNDAETYGLDDGSIHYTKGEIHMALNEKQQALGEFQRCRENTSDSYMQMRAFMMESKIYEEQYELQEERRVLLEARKTLPKQNQMVILEKLVQADINLADETGDPMYHSEAIRLLQEIIDNNWAAYEDYDTLAILYQKQNNLMQVADTLQTMEELYGADYNIHKRYAFLEVEWQNLLPQEDRDYNQFSIHCDQAESMYYAQMKDNNTDAEMDLLADVKTQLRQGGWL